MSQANPHPDPENDPDDAGSDRGDGLHSVEHMPLPWLAVRAGIGGVLMGLANLVPGISGGTMLLAAGVYPAFIDSIAELTTFRWRFRAFFTVGAIGGAAALAILLLAGVMKSLVIEARWVMYSLFIGLTFGGVPLVWRLARPATPALIGGAVFAFVAMLAMQLGLGDSGGGGPTSLMLVLSGLAGASAMILPGVSGGYLLLLLGEYERILGAVDELKEGLVSVADGAPDFALLGDAMTVVLPVGIGVVVGIVGVSNLLRWLLDHHAKATLGALLGLLFGAVVGLWPFEQPVPPQAGDVMEGRVLSAEDAAALDVEDWRTERFTPTGGQVAGALALIAAGLGGTLLIDHVGRDRPDSAATSETQA